MSILSAETNYTLKTVQSYNPLHTPSCVVTSDHASLVLRKDSKISPDIKYYFFSTKASEWFKFYDSIYFMIGPSLHNTNILKLISNDKKS